jgi:hypothetical protein
MLNDPLQLFKQKVKKSNAESRTQVRVGGRRGGDVQSTNHSINQSADSPTHSLTSLTRQLLMLISRVIGVHSLMLLNFYPYLQKYITPSRKDVTQLLAALVQACHDLVPPDALQPVLRQLVDQFVHDRARPEVITVGIKTVREMCMRAPLVMNEELLVELSEYKKHRDKEVATVARSLIGLFRELDASMLKKKDRGREGAVGLIDGTGARIAEYGSVALATEEDVVGDRVLTDEEHRRIREERMEDVVDEQLSIHGLQSMKRKIQETRVDPTSLLGKKRGRADKAERLASVMEGREGRMEFGAKAKLKKEKTGGLSNKEKERRKRVLAGGVGGQVARRLGRASGAKRKSGGKRGEKGKGKQFRGRVRQ